MQRQKDRSRGRITLLFLGLIVLILLALFGLPDRNDFRQEEKKFILLSFEDFHNLVGGRERLGPDHQRAMFGRYRGRYVRWAGEVYDIRKDVSGDFVLRIQHMAGARNFDVTLRLNATKAERLKRLSRGEAVSYSGRLASFDPETGYFLEDGDIE
jgi:hypothetical protein